MSTAADELDAITDPAIRETVLRVYNDPRIPTGPLGAWALAYARWRAGDRDTYIAPPSAARGVTIDAIERIERIVRDLVEWRDRRIPPAAIASEHHLRPRRRAADWNPTA